MRGMNIGMVFAVIFAVIVVVFLLGGGMQMITDLMGMGEGAQIQAKIAELRNSVSEIYWLPLESSKPIEFTVTPGIERACFLDYLDPRQNVAKGWEGNNVIETVVRQENYTVYIFKKDGTEEGFMVERARVSENFCIKSTLDIMLISKGKYVDIAPIVQ